MWPRYKIYAQLSAKWCFEMRLGHEVGQVLYNVPQPYTHMLEVKVRKVASTVPEVFTSIRINTVFLCIIYTSL